MAKSYVTFQKRQKERARQEKARMKRERREQRRRDKKEPQEAALPEGLPEEI